MVDKSNHGLTEKTDDTRPVSSSEDYSEEKAEFSGGITLKVEEPSLAQQVVDEAKLVPVSFRSLFRWGDRAAKICVIFTCPSRFATSFEVVLNWIGVLAAIASGSAFVRNIPHKRQSEK